ncbi:long-chain-fatty-acid--CoA ligase [Rhodococcus sp. LB1]|uniref:long-chain-fatty-acid--CoA ligase n=1 Tax=Rhodococcus sp. LB1 TaxID=1807499 RepID=UPI000779F7D5|nr:long-chain-fatty-acid--CoA ligase [Rhodococcus sp. LB1]KXX58934.1 long-chain fatty acid--CoA ligase [Rhodococcus sp. LB1]
MRVLDLLTHAAQGNPSGPATIFRDRSRTWNEVHDRVGRLAGALRALGVNAGDRVAVLGLNSDRFLEIHFAVPWAGAVLAPLNIRWAAPENLFALNDFRAKVLLVDDEFLDQATELHRNCPDLTTLIYIGEQVAAPVGTLHYEELITAQEFVEPFDGDPDDPYIVFYTSGTTGQSKGVVLTHRNAVTTARAFCETMPLDRRSVHLHVMGMFHVGGSQPIWYITMVGGTHVVHAKYVPADVVEAVERHRITNMVLVPTMISALLDEPGVDDRDLISVRTCVYGGSPMPRQILDRALKMLPSWGFHQIYGMTESSGYGVALRWEDHLIALSDYPDRLRAAGRSIPGTRVAVLDPDDKEVAPGTVGQIALCGDNIMAGYFGNPAATAETLANGWLHTGDAGFMDTEGFVYVSDRVKDVIITGGENVFSVDVERALYAHPAVRECAVIGIPDPKWVEAVHAVIVLRAGEYTSEEEMIAHCRNLIGGYKCPRSIEFVEGPLPTTPSGKIRKNVLREPWWKKLQGMI